MPTVTVPINLGDIEMAGRTLAEFRQRLERAFRTAIKTAARSSEARLRAMTPVSGRPWERAPGQLQASMHVYENPYGMTAKWEAPYAAYVDRGTPAHVVKGDMYWQSGPGVWAHSIGHMIRGIRPHNLTEQAKQVMTEELELALFTMILAEAGGIG